jgi:hypothetical protein
VVELAVGEASVDLHVELVDDLGRRGLRCADAVPGARLVTRHELSHGRDVRCVYAESCRYYLVFLDKHYREKVWTKYERDVMTRRGSREAHIVPVLLDEVGAEGAVGISATIGRIDLRDVWTEIQKAGSMTTDAKNAIRNRCVLPMLEKLDAASDAVRGPNAVRSAEEARGHHARRE